MKIVVIGSRGMLGADVCAECERRGIEVVALSGRGALDITDLDAVRQRISAECPAVVVNCAAWTDVDGAERAPDAAYRLNALGPWHLATACAESESWLVHVSTDFVFDGEGDSPYDEFDPVNPQSVYGRSKAAGEALVRQTLPARHIIARTAFLYGMNGDNIIEKIVRAAQTRPELTFVTDQIVSPTHTQDLARVLLDLAQAPLSGTYHTASSDACSLFALAEATVALAGHTTTVLPTTFAAFVERYQPAARRPRYSALDGHCLRLRGFSPLPPWKTALEAYFQRR